MFPAHGSSCRQDLLCLEALVDHHAPAVCLDCLLVLLTVTGRDALAQTHHPLSMDGVGCKQNTHVGMGREIGEWALMCCRW